MGKDWATARDDQKISMALMASFVVLSFQYLILICFNILGSGSASLVQIISKAMVALVFLYALPAVIKRNIFKGIIIYLIALLIFVLNYVFFPENQPYLKTILFPLFFVCLPSFVYSASIYDWAVLKKMMKKASHFVFIIGIVIGSGVLLGIASVGSYSMPFSYYMLFPAIIFIDELFNKFTLRTAICVFISLLIILALGSRGAVLCVAVFVFLKLLCPGDNLNYRGIILGLGILMTGLAGYIFREGILGVLNNIFLSLGIQSRSIALFLEKGVYLSGRDRIYGLIANKIASSPFWGIGLAGDRIPLKGSYAHNIFIEVLGNFGLIIGAFILLILLGLILRSVMTKDKIKHDLIIIWISLGFVHLMVSSSYLIDLKFWIFAGLVISSINFRIDNSKGSTGKT